MHSLKSHTTKSSIFPLTNPYALKSSLSHFEFQWSLEYIIYLGIKLSRSPIDSIRLNYQDNLSNRNVTDWNKLIFLG